MYVYCCLLIGIGYDCFTLLLLNIARPFSCFVFIATTLQKQHHTPYHCSEHAFHVALSVNKLIDLMLQTDPETTKTFGLRHDPLAQFAMLFAALIHDVEHKVRNDLRRQRDEIACFIPLQHEIYMSFSITFCYY